MQRAVRSMMREEFIDGLFISNSYNVQYISGFRGENAYALITAKGKYLITDGRHIELMSMMTKGFIIIDWQKKDLKLKEAINDIVRKEGIKRLGFEAEYLTYKQFTDLYDMTKAEITPVVGIIEKLREVKTQDEIEKIKTACEINDRVFERLIKRVRVNVSEKELSALCSYYIKMEGGDAQDSENVFLIGKRTSLIMDQPTEAVLEKGDLLLMNYGAKYQGYRTDFSRTVILGQSNEEQRRVYDTALRAQTAAIGSIRAGELVKEPFNESAKIIKEAGYYKYHYEGIGHGIGLDLLEEPFLDKNSTDILEENSVLTVEPGIYIPNWGGVRIEDVVVVMEGGCRRLSKTTRKLIEV